MAPWNRYKGAEDADGDVPEGVPYERTESSSSGSGDRVVIIETRQKAPRDFYIRKEDAEEHGYTRGCQGCSSWFRGLARQPHSEACRARFENLLKDKAKVKNAKDRKRDFEEKEMEKKRRKDEKKEQKKRDREGDGDVEDPEERTKRSKDEFLISTGRFPAGASSGSGQRVKRERDEDEDESDARKRSAIEVEEQRGIKRGAEEEEKQDVDVDVIGPRIIQWINEIRIDVDEQEEDLRYSLESAWDDVNGGFLDMKDVKAARGE